MQRITPVHYSKLIRLFELDGFSQRRQESGHAIMTKPGIKRPLVIPKYREIPVFVIKNNLRPARMSRGRYFKLLEQV
ncbi:MAG: type II toxin-antitoxin system HicA family toxin [Halobacteria archaeon]